MERVKPNLTGITKIESKKVSPSCQDYFVSPKTKNGKSIIQYAAIDDTSYIDKKDVET